MILSGKSIQSAVDVGNIIIHPYNKKQLNPNSYNLKLHNELLVYKQAGVVDDQYVLDMTKDNPAQRILIPDEGLVLYPGNLYLGRSVEYTGTAKYVPMLEGRSSVGRLGISIHATAGFGDVGFFGYWTLEISCVQPVRIYPGVDICQIYYHTMTEGDTLYSNGKYSDNIDIQTSKLWQDFQK